MIRKSPQSIKRIEISPALRRQAQTTTPQNIICADPRDIIAIVDRFNQLIDAWNREHPPEVSNRVLRKVLFGEEPR